MDFLLYFQKSRVRETKHLSTDADSSTDVIGGWTKNTPEPASYITASLKQARKISKKKKKNVRGNFRHFSNKNVHI
jgi:hypothetical protein